MPNKRGKTSVRGGHRTSSCHPQLVPGHDPPAYASVLLSPKRSLMLTTLHRPLSRSCMQSTSSALRPHNRTITTKAQLPRLPVPDLHQTLRRYLQSLEPFFLEDESRGGPSSESASALRARWASDFEAGLGSVSQGRLQGLFICISLCMQT